MISILCGFFSFKSDTFNAVVCALAHSKKVYQTLTDLTKKNYNLILNELIRSVVLNWSTKKTHHYPRMIYHHVAKDSAVVI